MKTRKLLLNALPLLLIGTAMVYAAAPSGGYLPGATTDPACAPGDTDCVVQLPSETPNKFVDGTDTNDAVFTAGKVGIGTTSPDSTLHLSADSGTPVKTTYGYSGGSGNARKLYIKAHDDGVGENVISIGRRVSTDTADDEVLTVSGNGKVGIGTSNPTAKLEISQVGGNGSSNFGGGVPFLRLRTSDSAFAEPSIEFQEQNNAPIASVSAKNINGGAGHLIFSTRNVGANTLSEKMRVLDNGNIGIGTGSPLTQFHVRSSGAGLPNNSGTSVSAGTISRFETSSSNGVIDFGNDGGNTATWIQSHSKADQSATWRLALNPNGGYVGIGTTSPATSLHLKADNAVLRIEGTTYSTIELGDTASPTSEAIYTNHSLDKMFFRTSNDNQMTIDDTGNVGIGTTSPTVKLDVNGGVKATSFNGMNIFLKAGNNGSASCDSFCSNDTQNWGVPGVCLGQKRLSDNQYLTCDTVASETVNCMCGSW